MRRDDMVATGEIPTTPEMPVVGWQVIAIRFRFPRLADVTAVANATAHEHRSGGG